MIGTILGILKVIGIIIGIILLLLLSIVLAVVFVPVRYKADLDKTGKEFQVIGRVSWLFHLVHANYIYTPQENKIVVRVFGINIDTISRVFSKVIQKIKNFRLSIFGKKEKKIKQKVVNENEYEDKTELTALEHKEKTPKRVLQKGSVKTKKGFIFKVKQFIEKMKAFPKLFITKLKKLFTTCKLIFVKIKDWKAFISQAKTKAAIKLLKKQSILLLKHIKPTALKGNVTFGLSDPSITGQLLGLAGMLYPLYGNNISIYPRFEEEILDVELLLKGRIQLFYVLRLVWKLYRDDNIKYVLHKFQTQEG